MRRKLIGELANAAQRVLDGAAVDAQSFRRALVPVGGLGDGCSVAVVGADGVGLSTVALAKALGAGRIVVVDVAADRLATAMALGSRRP